MTLENKELFANNLNKYIRMSGKDRKEIANSIGVPYSTITDWINANKYPRINNIEKLASFFNISKSDLIEDFEKIKKDNDALADIIVKLRMDNDLLELVEKIVNLDKNKVNSINRLLDTFI